MKSIYIDGDSSDNIKLIESIARKHKVPVILYCDSSHMINSDYSEVRFVEKGSDMADFAIVSHCKPGDIIITRDYGLAAMALSKKAICIHPKGAEYTEKIIDQLLFRRYCGSKYGVKGRKSMSKMPALTFCGITKLLNEKLKLPIVM